MPHRILIIVICLCFSFPGKSQNLDSLFAGGKTAYDSGRLEQAINYFHKFEEVRDNYPPVVMYLAMLYSRTDEERKACEYLTSVAVMNADTAFLNRSDFDKIRDSESFKHIEKTFEYMLDSVRHSEYAFSPGKKSMHPEALAYDAERSRFFIGSIRLRSIFVYESGRSYAFKAEAEDSLLAVTGLAIDREEGLLWVASANLPQMRIQEDGAQGSFVHVYDIMSGSLLRRFHLADDVLLGDLIVGKRGEAYMTNSRSPEIYMGSIDSVNLWKSFPNLLNLQGIAEGNTGEIFFSDYIHGIYRIYQDSLQKISNPDTISVKGIDGLYYRKGNLIGIQNGVFPKRVTQFTLDEEHRKIIGTVYLDKNLPDMDEPVQGAWVGDWFYFIANSPWGFYDDQYNLSGDVPEPEVWRTNLAR
ncbi:MAG: hypothetical protein P8X57_13110 [Cyclobacteriaceae bacterium]